MQINQSLKDKNVVAVVSTEFLEPAFGKGTTIQPATYADHGYNIAGGIAAIDSVQSQANRLEAIFKQEPYTKLVPQVVVNTMNLLELGHRLADAVMSYSSGNEIVREALQGAAKGDFIPLAKINPTALLLGIWDSRNNGVKIARTLGFTVDAKGVTTVRDRAAQYRASIDTDTKTALESHLNAGENSEKRTRSRLSEEGFNDVPSYDPKKGGCIASEIVRQGALQLTPLRKYDEKLQNYLLGLGLVMLSYPLDHNYRSGTLLVQDPAQPATLELVYRNGKREAVEVTHDEALTFAQEAAGAFGVGPDHTFTLDQETYKKYQRSGSGEKKTEKAKSKTIAV